MPYCAARCGWSSTFTFPTVACPSHSTVSSSIVGVRTRHGPHHGAQQSTRTGLRAVEDIPGEMRRAEGGVPGVFRGHTMLLALLWGASIPCDGVCGRVQTAINGSHPLDALVTEHLTSAHDFSGLAWEPWQPAASRHPSGQRKSRSSLTESGLQRST